MVKIKTTSIMLLFLLQCAGIFALVSPIKAVENLNTRYTQEPAPMGIADYGIDPVDNSAYSYNTTVFQGAINIYSLSTKDGSDDFTATLQLNAVLEYEVNSKVFVYWLQNVLWIDTSTNNVSFFDNIWNDSAVDATLYNSTIHGNGWASPSGSTNFYSDWANTTTAEGNNIDLTYPTSIYIDIDLSTNMSGNPLVGFEYNDGHGWYTYDRVSFSINGVHAAYSNLVVDGSRFTPNGYYFDVELILGGGLSTGTTVDTHSNVSMYIIYLNGASWNHLSDSYNYGSNTGETISNVVDTDYKGNPDDNFLTAGAGSLSPDLNSTTYTPLIGFSLIPNLIGIVSLTTVMVILVSFKRRKMQFSP